MENKIEILVSEKNSTEQWKKDPYCFTKCKCFAYVKNNTIPRIGDTIMDDFGTIYIVKNLHWMFNTKNEPILQYNVELITTAGI